MLIKELKKRKITNGICIVGEPTKMKIIDSHKACYEYTTFFEGLAGHSSKPDEGVNAAEYASRYVNKLMSLRNDLKNREPDDSIFTPPYSTPDEGVNAAEYASRYVNKLMTLRNDLKIENLTTRYIHPLTQRYLLAGFLEE